jgi:tetratricopeptide (TPR) repeat protein
MSKRYIIATIVGVLIIMGGVAFIFLSTKEDFGDSKNQKREMQNGLLDSSTSTTGDATTTVNSGVEGKGSFTVTPGDPVPGTTNILPPSLDRKIEITDRTLPKESADIALKRIPELIVLLQKDLGNNDAWLELALYRTHIGDYRGAEEIYIYLYKTRPKNTVVVSNLANLYAHNIKDFPTAERYFAEVIKLEPKNPVFYDATYNFYRYLYTAKSSKAEETLLIGIK